MARQDRRSEVQELLRDRDLTIPRFCELALQQQEISRIEVWKLDSHMGNPNRLTEISQGFDCNTIESFVQEKWGPGKYRFSPVGTEGKYWTHRTWGIGPEVAPQPMTTPATGGDGDGDGSDTADSVMSQLAKTLKSMGVMESFKAFIAERETAQVNREVAPLKTMAELMKVMAPQRDDAMLKYLLEQNASLQQTLLQIISAKATGGAGGDSLDASVEMLGRITQLAAQLGFVRADGTGAAASGWSPENIGQVVQTATPLLREALGTLRVALAKPGVATPAEPQPAPTVATLAPPTEGAQPMGGLSDDDKELIGIAVNSLRSKDWDTFEAAYEAARARAMLQFGVAGGALLPALNPKVNAALFVHNLKRIDPVFDTLRVEFQMFLDWMKEEEARLEAEAAAGGAPNGRE